MLAFQTGCAVCVSDRRSSGSEAMSEAERVLSVDRHQLGRKLMCFGQLAARDRRLTGVCGIRSNETANVNSRLVMSGIRLFHVRGQTEIQRCWELYRLFQDVIHFTIPILKQRKDARTSIYARLGGLGSWKPFSRHAHQPLRRNLESHRSQDHISERIIQSAAGAATLWTPGSHVRWLLHFPIQQREL